MEPKIHARKGNQGDNSEGKVDMKSLTIAIPTYKSEYSLGRLLDSILDSPDSAKLVSEILISDNDPNSKLGLLIERKYQHESEIAIRYLKNDKNLGYDGNLY